MPSRLETLQREFTASIVGPRPRARFVASVRGGGRLTPRKAVEVYRRGLAQLLSGIDREHVTNIRLIRGDAVDVLDHLLAPGSLSGVRVFFPDPWPKARHHKRRLLQPAVVATIADRLRPGGVLHAATDHADYAEQIAEVGAAEPLLTRLDIGADAPVSTVRPTTKYEGKAEVAELATFLAAWDKEKKAAPK